MPNQATPVDPLFAALEKLPLWNHFEEIASVEQRATVRALLGHADALLSRVVETFPTYTLHDRTHAINVARLMGELAGPFLPRMEALEAGLLLLSAFWHDVGMVFSEEERATISETEEFQEFLRTHPEAQLEVAEEGNVSRAVAEWYCRWSHAERVFLHLGQVDDELEWDGIPFRQRLGDLCRSHNLDAEQLKRDDLCPTRFLGIADVRFCAILLRLADILDFDRTRSPDAIYRYLGIGRRANSRESDSDVEWRKHLTSTGFAFPTLQERGVPYPLTFVAAPDAPAVEWDVRHFLDGIEGEILACQQLVLSCSPRWRDLVLPTRIERELHSQNYTFGDYRFLLEQEQVLGLLMGENLYRDPHVFIRELLQNAIDTSRHREFHERARGNREFRCEPIVVSTWYDREQYYWVRLDDYGMGMTEEIVRDFLLRVGHSYYTSAAFKAEQLQYNAQKRFTPISRFGIGLLSCFIVGDRVEISTRHATHAKSKFDSIRLSLSGLHGFFTLQTGKEHNPTAMPAKTGDEGGYRLKPGTSIAVRLDPRKERGILDVGKALQSHLLYPPVAVHYDGMEIGGDPAELESPWLPGMLEIELTQEQMWPFVHELAADPATQLRIRLFPIDLSSNAPNDNLRGRLVTAQVVWQSRYYNAEILAGIRRTYWLAISGGNVQVASSIRSNYMLGELRFNGASAEEAEHLSKVKSLLEAEKGEIETKLRPIIIGEPYPKLGLPLNGRAPGVQLAHNGIRVDYPRGLFRGVVDGTITLLDGLRPDVAVSREHTKHFPWNLCLSLELAHRHAARKVASKPALLGEGLPSRSGTVLRDLLGEPLLNRGSAWLHEPIFEVTVEGIETRLSASDLNDRIQSLTAEIRLTNRPEYLNSGWTLEECIRRVILSRDFSSVLHLSDDSDDSSNSSRKRSPKIEVCVTGIRKTPLSSGELLFPPLTFIPFRGSESLILPRYRFINLSHPLGEWLLGISPRLAERFPGILNSITEFLLETNLLNDQKLREFNRIMDRLRGIDANLTPPASLQLTSKDFVYSDYPSWL